ncbi:serpin-ZX-like [Trifolium pratense]|uniref:serpin-ZX-like n=1 Tax=Trifolium pratense TaxID=57577 RepID=UPI001E694DCF|nr:serpin-ZX-like [Trifolium pratense]
MDLRKSIACQTDVALSITKHLFSKQEYHDNNLIFSPFSLHAVLSVMAAGSEGSTLDELISFLRFDSIDHLNTFFSQLLSDMLSNIDATRLSFVNGMWADKSVSLSHSFKQLVTTHYKVSCASVNFRTKGDKVRHEVNSWVEEETNGLITKLIPPKAVGKLTRLIFANALHFKGEWKHKFDPAGYNKFHLLNGKIVYVIFMRSKKKKRFISTFDGFKVLRLSYKQGIDKKRRFSMYIFLPDAEDGLPALIEKLASESGYLKDKLPRRKVRVSNFKIPKFKISFTLEASNVLQEVGVISPFSQEARFTNMVESPSGEEHVESMFHKASIEVNEEGTEATTANSTVLIKKGKRFTHRSSGIDFVADHPFLFMIREDFTGTILFIGKVLDPRDGVATPVRRSNFKDDVSDDDEYLNKLPSLRNMSKQDMNSEKFIMQFRKRLRYYFGSSLDGGEWSGYGDRSAS